MQILTFDSHGVSSHPNHIAAFHGARLFAQQSQLNGDVDLYALETYPLTTKFLGLPHALWSHALYSPSLSFPSHQRTRTQTQKQDTHHRPTSLSFLSTTYEYAQTLRAMRQHATQLVWFRYLYVVFSSYMIGGRFGFVG